MASCLFFEDPAQQFRAVFFRKLQELDRDAKSTIVLRLWLNSNHARGQDVAILPRKLEVAYELIVEFKGFVGFEARSSGADVKHLKIFDLICVPPLSWTSDFNAMG
jgi:hypothetical protein